MADTALRSSPTSPSPAAPRRDPHSPWDVIKDVLGYVPPILIGAALVWLAVTAFHGSQTGQTGQITAQSNPQGYHLQLSFGLSRSAVTRSSRINLCTDPKTATSAECPGVTGTAPDTTPTTAGAQTATERPQVLTAGLADDLTRNDHRAEFPANQVSITASNVGREGLLIAVTADPTTPRVVLDGTYTGTIVVERAGSTAPIVVQMEADLDTRAGTTSKRAIAALLLGGLIGGGVRWLDTVLAPMAQLRRRQRRIRPWFQRRRTNLPEGAVETYKDVNRALRDLDTDGVDAGLTKLAAAEPDLLAFAHVRDTIAREIAEQRRLVGAGVPGLPDVANALETESAYTDDLLHRPWPWEANVDVRAGYTKALEHCRQLTAALRLAVLNSNDPATVAAANSLARQIVVAGADGLEQDLPVAPAADAARAKVEENALAVPPPSTAMPTKQSLPIDHRRNFAQVALDNVWWVTLIIGAGVVAFVGYQTQFLNNKDFNGSLTDYVQLFGWALALQIAGTTVVTVAARLTTSGAAAGT
jgi:hypothetical protein